MNIVIITQRLANNYGGTLQNYALQKVLRKLNHSSITVDIAPRQTPWWMYLCSWIKTVLFFLAGRKGRKFAKITKVPFRNKFFDNFVSDYIRKTDLCSRYSKKCISKCCADAVIVGSDQVWRPGYNSKIEDMYLKFAEGLSIKRIAYAASFGVDCWEYTPKQSRECSRLAKKFDAISVREESGVKLCKDCLGVDATWVLDPTLLLTKEDYLPICEEVPICNEKYLAVYVLDESDEVTATYEKEAETRGLVIKKFYADSKSTLTVPEWLAVFRDASYVVTDSFHGTVFSVIFGKDFKCIYNKDRGAARFESLLNLYNSGKLEEMRCFSLNWLKNALSSSLDKDLINDIIK